MKKLSYENGDIVIRDIDGTLVWSAHIADTIGCYQGEFTQGGYKTILLEGNLFEKCPYYETKKIEL